MHDKVLIVDDEKNLTTILSAALEKASIDSVCFNESKVLSGDVYLDQSYGAVLLDLRMPHRDGMEILQEIKLVRPNLPIIMMTAFGTIESAVQALKLGAFDFITKPFNLIEIVRVIQKALSFYKDSQKDISSFSYNTMDTLEVEQLLGPSLFVNNTIYSLFENTNLENPILITGERGTGKEILAWNLHIKSLRKNFPFIKLNCISSDMNTLEADLFGFQSGAFTDTFNSKPGKIELAHQGVIFLDEIGELSTDLQSKVLSVLKQKCLQRVGGAHTVTIDIAVIASTSKDLSHEVSCGSFNEDLYNYFCKNIIHLPSLRDRREDIPTLIDFFNRKISSRYKKNKVVFSKSAIDALHGFSWQGNIRQLENTMSRLVLLSNNEAVDFIDLPEEIRLHSQDFKEIVKHETQRLEKGLIEKALIGTDGNITQAANFLGLSRKGLQIKMKELGLRKEPT